MSFYICIHYFINTIYASKTHFTQIHFFKLCSSIINQFHWKLNHVSSYTPQCKPSTKTRSGSVQRKQDGTRDSFFLWKNATVVKLPVSRVFTPTAAPALRQGHSKFCPTAAAPGFQTKERTDTSYSFIAAVSRLPSKGNQAALQVKCTPMLYPSRGGIGKSRDANHGDQMGVYTNTETKTSHF